MFVTLKQFEQFGTVFTVWCVYRTGYPSLVQATGDPYYLDVGRTVVNNLNKYARVPCGFAAIKDLKSNTHEDR